MSLFVLCRGPRAGALADKVRGRLGALGLPLETLDATTAGTVLHRRSADDGTADYLAGPDGDFILKTGMFSYRSRAGREALSDFLADFDLEAPSLEGTLGQFTLLLCKGGRTALLTDALGVNKVYHNQDFTVLSNAFVGVAESLDGAVVDRQGCYEYAWNGTAFGGRTFLDNVVTLPFGRLALLSGADGIELRGLPAPTVRESTATVCSFDALVELHLSRLRALMAAYHASFGDGINLSLSGGYDSRLLLALLIEAGIRPRAFVYGSPGRHESEIVRRIAEGESIEFELVDKSTHPRIPPEGYADHLRRNYGLFDGWKVYGLFDGGADVPDRRMRVAGGRTLMNGSLGEVYRNFFYLSGRRFDVRELVWSFYARYAPKFCTALFDPRAYELGVAEAILAALGGEQARLARESIELVYPLFRGRYWTGRDVAINQGFGPCLFPFLEPSVIVGTCDIPISFKDFGRFESAMIRRISPRIAAYPSSYGHSFGDDPPLAYRAKMQLTHRRPPILRRYSYRLQQTRHQAWPYFLAPDYLSEVIDPGFPFMARYFRVARIADPAVYNRVATMEYVCQRLG